MDGVFFVGPLGLEPRMTEPKSVVLPITPWASAIGACKFKTNFY